MSPRQHGVTLAATAFLLALCPVQAAWLFDLEAGAFHDDNIGSARHAHDIVDDDALYAAGSASWLFDVGDASTLTLGLKARGETYRHVEGLDMLAIGPSLSFRHKFGLGWQALWTEFELSILRERYRADVRDGDRYNATWSLGRRFTERFSATVQLGYDHRDTRIDRPVIPGLSGSIFELSGKSLGVRADHAFGERWLLSAAYDARRGDVASVSHRDFEVFQISTAIAPDPALGDGFYGYRVKGTTRTTSVGLSYALGDDSSINLNFDFSRTRAGSLVYDRKQLAVFFRYRYW